MNGIICFDYLLDYLRMVCYSVIVLTDLRNIVNRKYSATLYIGDIIMAFALFVTVSNIPFTKFDQVAVAQRILTPAAIIWASIHFYEFIRNSDKA